MDTAPDLKAACRNPELEQFLARELAYYDHELVSVVVNDGLVYVRPVATMKWHVVHASTMYLSTLFAVRAVLALNRQGE